jgi:hypothetical protein
MLGIGIDVDGNIVAAWTSALNPATTLTPNVGAAIRSASTGVWSVTPEVPRRAGGSTGDVVRVGIARGAAWIYLFGIYGPGDYLSTVLTSNPASGQWRSKSFSRGYGLYLPINALASAPNGFLMAAWSGMWIANFDNASPLRPPRALPRAVLPSGRRLALLFSLTRPARVYVRIFGTRVVVRLLAPTRTFDAGTRRLVFDRLPRGSYTLGLTACSPRAGCDLGIPRSLQFRVR